MDILESKEKTQTLDTKEFELCLNGDIGGIQTNSPLPVKFVFLFKLFNALYKCKED